MIDVLNRTKAESNFRTRLKAQVKRADIKIVTLAKLSGASANQVNRWLQGDLMPTYYQFERINAIFGLDDDYLLGNGISQKAYDNTFKNQGRPQ